MTNIVLLGAPGAGKDTLVLQLQKKISCNVISPGTILRREADLGTPLGIEAKNKYWGKGNLCPDDIINKMIASALERFSRRKVDYNIFNGYPRSLGQAEFLEDINSVDIVLDLSVMKKTATERLLSRRREDDTKEVIEQRFFDYSENNSDVVKFYKDKGVYHKINANQMIPRVLKDSLKIINNV